MRGRQGQVWRLSLCRLEFLLPKKLLQSLASFKSQAIGLVLLMAPSFAATSVHPVVPDENARRVGRVAAQNLQTVPVSSRATLVAQMSRHEHDKLRLELREGMHRPVKIGPLDELGFGRLTIRERRLLREQLRRQSDENIDGATISVASPAQEPRPETTDAAIATIAVPESVDVSRPVIEPNQ